MQLTTNGIILADWKNEDDRVLSILTEDRGLLTAYANGANKLRSRLAASTELLCYSRFVLFLNRGRYVVDAADSNRLFFGIRSDIEKLALASYFAALTRELAPLEAGGEETAAMLRLLLNCLHFIENSGKNPRLLKPLFELRMLTLAGYMPELVACRGCNCYEADEMLFLPLTAGLVCGGCANNADRLAGIPLSKGALAAMRHIVFAQPEKLFAFTLSDSGLGAIGEAAERYVLARLEKTLPALEFLQSLSIRPLA